jgi:hypothetical protein
MIRDAMTKEDSLLVQICCWPRDASLEDAADKLGSIEGLDWEMLVQTALENRVIYLLAHRLRAHPGVPTKVAGMFGLMKQIMQAEVAHQSNVFEGALPYILRYNNVLLLRGISYYYTQSHRRTERAIGDDIDLLIDTPYLVSIRGLLSDHYTLPPDVKSQTNGCSLEYHKDLDTVGGFKIADIDMNRLWHRAQLLDINGCTVRILSQEDDFICLAYHNVLKGLSRLYRFVDLLELARSSNFDWREVIERSQRYRVSKAVWINCYALNQLWRDCVPANVFVELRPSDLIEKLLIRCFDLRLLMHNPHPRCRTVHSSFVWYRRKQVLKFMALVSTRNWYKLLLGRRACLNSVYVWLYRLPRIGRLIERVRARVQKGMLAYNQRHHLRNADGSLSGPTG